MQFDRSAYITFEGEDIQDIEGLRIAFEVEKNDGDQFNAGNITIFNLNEKTRKKVAKTIAQNDELVEPITVHLYAGYGDEQIQLVAGDILEAKNYRAGPDWITQIDVRSGLANAHKGFAKQSYSTKTAAKKIIDDMLAALNMDIQYTDDARQALLNQFVTSYSYSALAIDEVRYFLTRYDLEFTIEEHDQCLIYKRNSPRDKLAARNNLNTFKPANGLINTPAISRHGVSFQCLLRPNIRILQRIWVESQSINSSIQNNPQLASEFFVTKIRHIGDTRGKDWFTEITAAYTGLAEGYY